MKTAWTEKCFNSTLVQLKVSTNGTLYVCRTCFNSTLVQLKAIAFPCISVVSTGFNSTLVQLKDGYNFLS